MKARLPKSYELLPESEKKKINDIYLDAANRIANQMIDKEEAKLQKLWLKFACIVLHNGFHFTKEDCMVFLADWRQIYRKNARFETEQEQTSFMDEHLTFFDGEYPTEFVDSLEGITDGKAN